MLYIISYVLELHCNTKLFCPKLDLIIAQINQRQNHIQFCLNGLVHDSLRAIRVENFYQNKKNSDCLAAKVSECWCEMIDRLSQRGLSQLSSRF